MHQSRSDGSQAKYTVNQWCSHPDAGNDDCVTGDDFDSLEEAKASHLYTRAPYYVAYIEIDGPVGSDHYELVKNPHYSARTVALEDSLERSERAMQAGMAFGCQGYNDEMGF